MTSTIYNITPCPAPRMTKSDKWKQRPRVMRYFAFRDHVKVLRIHIPEYCLIRFWVPMPASWSAKKKALHVGKPHLVKPDVDNLSKALFDSVYQSDAHIWKLNAEKVWSYEGAIEIEY